MAELVEVVGGYIVRQLESGNHRKSINHVNDHPELSEESKAEMIISEYLHYYQNVPWELLGRVMEIV